MKWTNRFLGLWSLDGTIDRLPFLSYGVLLFLLKYTLDSVVALQVFGKPWLVSYYWPGAQVALWLEAPVYERAAFGTMLLLAAPFVWLGIALTAKRIRAAGLPLWTTLLFFLPVLNLVFFTGLALAPTTVKTPPSAQNALGGMESRSHKTSWRSVRSFWAAVLITAFFGSTLTAFNVFALGVYGAGLFVGLPFGLGLVAAVLVGFSDVRRCGQCVKAALASVTAVGLVLVLTAFEGVVCLLMAAPIWIVCAALGGVVGYHIQRYARDQREAAVVAIGIVLTIPVLMGMEYVALPRPPVFALSTPVVIDAPPATVWRHVVSFPDLPAPQELIFRAGVAYPIGATIAGAGVGAERRCRFSTGDFVEPIEVWDEPRLLRFAVTENPPPMTELSLFADIDAPHLHGFLQSRRGQFALEALSDGRTRLEGTTWYEHNMWPAAYWRLWSDAIIHTIHARVLRHIQTLSESESCASVATVARE